MQTPARPEANQDSNRNPSCCWADCHIVASKHICCENCLWNGFIRFIVPVFFQERISHHLPHQHSICKELKDTGTVSALRRTTYSKTKPHSSGAEYLDPCGLRIRAVVKSDGVAHLMPQQGPPLLCNTVSHLSAGKKRDNLKCRKQDCVFAVKWH